MKRLCIGFAGLAYNEAIITYHVVEQVWTCCDSMLYMDRTFRLTWMVSAQHEQQTVFVMESHSGKYPTYITKGSLISERFSFWLQYLKNGCQITILSTIHKRRNGQDSDLIHSFGDLSQSEKLSEIKPPLNIFIVSKIRIRLI
jgi:hypothetical protein